MLDTVTLNALNPAFRHLWRAHVAARGADTEITVFVNAATRDAAHRGMRSVVSAIYPALSAEDLDEAYYNLTSADNLLTEGVSTVIDHRLFETGWRGTQVTNWVEQPVFAVSTPAALVAAWSRARLCSADNR